MANILDRILTHKRERVEAAKSRVSQSQLVIRAEASARPRNFFAAVTRKVGPAIRLIAQVEQGDRFPSPATLAKAFHSAGAVALACTTDADHRPGASLSDLDTIKAAVPLPVLRRDWVIDPYQLYESRVYGADAVVLPAEGLHEADLIDLLILSSQLQLTALLEVHTTDGLLKVRPHVGFPLPGYCLLAIQNRDLKTGKADPNHTLRLIDMVEDTSILVSESGVGSHADAKRLTDAGVRAILMDDGLCDQPDPDAALRVILQGE